MSSSVLHDNRATQSGGAIAILGGAVHFSDQTVLLNNTAGESAFTVYFVGGSLDYTLPAPLGECRSQIAFGGLLSHSDVPRHELVILRSCSFFCSTLGLRERWRCARKLRPDRR